ncbi:16S rRNA (guanine(527)-N(7))-methyltransferase RsmG [Spirulina subsalsa FACHB-351]|uniref:Ribosomal RNA small subunit methyltransferase G n=1 Tax=Spirulina subsalsa FACHB-351 TaxID=234711 RepID=A0ABT3LAV0_9CYAN|nr:16S rRNA (guanine(527)-N(7))-methyltransferase RsmG [Spirulina subsalsa]MCW6038214.1 16S rRNA (guanine(527)-N(7))-methyltransferase RsmG [Spirulina subsalsa FACHB-351]
MTFTLPWSELPLNALNDAQKAQCETFYQILLAQNKTLNLTRITDPLEFLEKHIWDSLAGLWHLPPSLVIPTAAQVIDIGTGGGFPGVPMAITYPDYAITLLDSTQKKVLFLQSLIEQLSLSSVEAIASRAEEMGQNPQHRETYDLAVLRAVSSPASCLEYALPLLKIGGIALLYRGQWSEEEAALLEQIAPQLGGQAIATIPYETPLTHSIRHAVYLQKIHPTPPQFPRRVGVPQQRPLS